MGNETSNFSQDTDSIIDEIRKIGTDEINAITNEKDMDIFEIDWDGRKELNRLKLAGEVLRVSKIYKNQLRSLNKEILKDTMYNLGIKPSRMQENKSAITITQVRDRVLEFYITKFELILYVLENLEIRCRDKQDVIKNNFRHILGPEKKDMSKREREDRISAEIRFKELNDVSKEYYSAIRNQLKKLRKDINYQEMKEIDRDVRLIMKENWSRCCTKIYNLRNFVWIPVKDANGDTYYYNPFFSKSDADGKWELPSSLEESGGLPKLALDEGQDDEGAKCLVSRAEKNLERQRAIKQ
jgi:hypothetical protein